MRDELVCHAVGKVLLLRIAGKVLQWQHRDRVDIRACDRRAMVEKIESRPGEAQNHNCQADNSNS